MLTATHERALEQSALADLKRFALDLAFAATRRRQATRAMPAVDVRHVSLHKHAWQSNMHPKAEVMTRVQLSHGMAEVRAREAEITAGIRQLDQAFH